MTRSDGVRRAVGRGSGWALLLVGCARATAAPATPSHDAPVPPNEPRAEVVVALDLAPAPDCEERFDLALYTHPGVELVAWDDRAGQCDDRRATLRYFPRRLDRDALLGRVRELAVTARPVEAEKTE